MVFALSAQSLQMPSGLTVILQISGTHFARTTLTPVNFVMSRWLYCVIVDFTIDTVKLLGATVTSKYCSGRCGVPLRLENNFASCYFLPCDNKCTVMKSEVTRNNYKWKSSCYSQVAQILYAVLCMRAIEDLKTVFKGTPTQTVQKAMCNPITGK